MCPFGPTDPGGPPQSASTRGWSCGLTLSENAGDQVCTSKPDAPAGASSAASAKRSVQRLGRTLHVAAHHQQMTRSLSKIWATSLA